MTANELIAENLILADEKGQTDTQSALRFITCGSVDDGKSTLIGRLLVDSKAVVFSSPSMGNKAMMPSPAKLTILPP